MVMQLHHESASDDDETADKTTTKGNAVNPSEANSVLSLTESTNNTPESKDGSVSEKTDETQDQEENTLTTDNGKDNSNVDSRESTESDVAVQNGVQDGKDDIVSVRKNSTAAIPDVSVVMKRLDYFSLSGTVQVDSDQKSSDNKKKNASRTNRTLCQNTSQSSEKEQEEGPNKKVSGNKSESSESTGRVSRTMCLICCTYVPSNDMKKHLEDHRQTVLGDKPRRRTYGEFRPTLTDVQVTANDNRGNEKSSDTLTKSRKKIRGRWTKSLPIDEEQDRGSSNSKAKNAKKNQNSESARTFVCDECEKSYVYIKDLKIHKSKIHRVKRERDEGNELLAVEERQDGDHGGGENWCRKCDRHFRKHDNLVVHMMRVHNMDKDTAEPDQSFLTDRKRKSEQSIPAVPAKKVKSNAVSTRQDAPTSSWQQSPWQQTRASTRQQTPTQYDVRANKKSLNRSQQVSPVSDEPLVILPFLSLSTSTASSASTAGSGHVRLANSTERVDLSDLGKPKEVRREVVRKYRKSGPFGEEEITETITEIW